MDMERYDFDTPVNRLHTDSMKWDGYSVSGHDLIPLWVADMDFKTAPEIVEALVHRAAHGIFGYSFPGDEYYDAISSWFERRHHWHIDRDLFIPTTGVLPALAAVLRAVTRPGDGVVVQTPVYNCFFSSIRNAGCRNMNAPLHLDSHGLYQMDFESLEKALADPKSTAMVLCNPHNPGGRVWSAEDLRRVYELCRKHDVTLISDEIHCEIVFAPHIYTPMSTLCDGDCITMISPSKAFNLAGLQVANIVVKDAHLHRLINRAINDNETCDISPFAIIALQKAYNEGEAWLQAMLRYVHANYESVRDYVSRSISGMRILPLEGTYLAWADCREMLEGRGQTVAEFAEALRRDTGVLVQPGTAYGVEGEGFVRINLATTRALLAEGMRRMRAYTQA